MNRLKNQTMLACTNILTEPVYLAQRATPSLLVPTPNYDPFLLPARASVLKL